MSDIVVTEILDSEVLNPEVETQTETIVEVVSSDDPAITDATSTDWILIYIVFFVVVMFWMTRSER